LNIFEFVGICSLGAIVGGVIGGVLGGPILGGIGAIGGAILGGILIVVEQLYTIIGLLKESNDKEIQKDIK